MNLSDKQLRMIHSKYEVKKRDYDEGHGGPVPSDYNVQNQRHFVGTLSSHTEAQELAETHNEMRIILIKQLLEEALETK